MVGVDSEREGAVRKMGSLFNAGANISVPLVAIFLRKGYGLGAMAMVGGSFYIPIFTASRSSENRYIKTSSNHSHCTQSIAFP